MQKPRSKYGAIDIDVKFRTDMTMINHTIKAAKLNSIASFIVPYL